MIKLLGTKVRHPSLVIKRVGCVRYASSSTETPIILPDQLDKIDSHKFCVAQVKRHDRENYLAALCMKDSLFKRAIFALRAFNVELSLIRDSTTNSDRAKLRFHFWSKLVEEIVRRNNEADPNIDKLNAYYKHAPVAKELLDIFYLINVDDSVQERLKDLIGARVSSKVLGYKPFETVSELELYCHKSNASLYHLGCILGQQLHNTWFSNYDILDTAQKVAANLGIAHGLSNIIRGIPYNATKNCCYIPQDLLKRYQMTNRDFVTKNLDAMKIAPVVEHLAERCQELLNLAHRDNKYIPNYFRDLFLPRIAVQSNLNRLKKCNYNICDPSVSKPNGLLPLSLWMGSKYFRAPIL